MKIPSNELEDLHPEGAWRAIIKTCSAAMKPEDNSYDVKVTFSTKVGTLQQIWNTNKLSWKVKILRDAVGMAGDFDTDAACGKQVDIIVKNVPGDKRTFQNVEVHAAGAKTDEEITRADGPPTASGAPSNVPF